MISRACGNPAPTAEVTCIQQTGSPGAGDQIRVH